MEFALSESNERIVAKPHTKGFCPVCKTPMIPKCGKVYADHWAHKFKAECDPWWENETKWHRQWKEKVLCDFREIVIEKQGIKHRADVQLPSGIIFEFQKNSLSIDERQAREKFYDNMIWVVHFPREKILEMNHRKLFTSLFGVLYVKVKSISEGFYRPPHLCPIFLDFDDGEMFWIKEFEDYNDKRAKWIYGKLIKKSDFINEYLSAPFLPNIDDLKPSNHHRDIEKKEEELKEARRQLDFTKFLLQSAKEESLLEKRQKWYAEGSREWIKLGEDLQKLREDTFRKRIRM